jgi:hypothetical protein
MRYLLLLTCIFCLSVLPSFGQFSAMSSSQPQLEKAAALARKSLGDLSQVARKIDIKSIGFDDQKQVGEAKLGVPISDYLIRLDELKEYPVGRPATELMHATGRLLYPLEVGGKARSAVTLSLSQENWQLESFGSANQISMVTGLREALARKEGRTAQELFQVRVPALQLLFVGFERSSKIYLAPLFNMPSYGLKKGETYQAEKVLERLVEAAKWHNGDPT